MNAKHTPGPWMIGQDYGGNYAICSSRAKVANHVATIPVFNGLAHSGASQPHEASVAEANARLMSAAPELLEACYTALQYLAPYRYAAGARVVIQSAIAKATGEGA